jgi:5-formyltetrahydrofolate cyclo-ligase
MHADDIKKLKKQTRAAALSRRDAMPVDLCLEKSNRVVERLKDLAHFKNASCVFIYISVRSEVLTREIIREVLRKKKKVCVPFIDAGSRTMFACRIHDIDNDVHPGCLGIPAPDPRICPPVAVHEIDLAVVPGLAFTVQGQRIGHGGGYYDRFLDVWQGTSCALAFEEQIVESLPFDPSCDRSVSCIITELRVIDCALP